MTNRPAAPRRLGARGVGDATVSPGTAHATCDLPLQGLQQAAKQVRLREVEPNPADSRAAPGYGDPQGLGAMERSKPVYESWRQHPAMLAFAAARNIARIG
jgi:hypothetical protein